MISQSSILFFFFIRNHLASEMEQCRINGYYGRTNQNFIQSESVLFRVFFSYQAHGNVHQNDSVANLWIIHRSVKTDVVQFYTAVCISAVRDPLSQVFLNSCREMKNIIIVFLPKYMRVTIFFSCFYNFYCDCGTEMGERWNEMKSSNLFHNSLSIGIQSDWSNEIRWKIRNN